MKATDVLDALANEDMQFEVDQKIGEQTADDVLTGADGEEEQKIRIGTLIIHTLGSWQTLRVPYGDFKQKVIDLGLPSSIVPPPVSPAQAFTRAKNDLVREHCDTITYQNKDMRIEVWNDGHHTKYIVGEYLSKGEAETVTLGSMEYDSDTMDVYYNMNTDIQGTTLESEWTRLKNEFQDLHDYHQNHLTAQDITSLQDRLHSTAVHNIKIRRSVYFYPAFSDVDEILRKFNELYKWLNEEHKSGGEPTEFYWTPLFNRPEDQDFVHRKLIEDLEDEMDRVIDQIQESLLDDEEIDRIVRKVLEPALNQMETRVEKYEVITNQKLRVRRMLKQKVENDLNFHKEQFTKIIEEAENQQQITDY